MIGIGDKVKDVITGYEGIVLAVSTWLYNVNRIAIQKQELVNNKIDEAIWIDQTPRIELVEKGVFKNIVVEPETHDFNELDEVEDTITSIRGIITGFVTWYSGCIRAVVTTKKLDKDNNPVDLHVSVKQLKKILSAVEPRKTNTGGPMRDPKVY